MSKHTIELNTKVLDMYVEDIGFQCIMGIIAAIEEVCKKGSKHGLCHTIELHPLYKGDIFEVQDCIYPSWEHFSGEDEYPVPSTKKGRCPWGAYHHARDKWDKRTKYGRLRHDLARYTIRCLEESLDRIDKHKD